MAQGPQDRTASAFQRRQHGDDPCPQQRASDNGTTTPSRAVANPFGERPQTQVVGALIGVEQQRAIAEVQARMIIARSNPRDSIRCMDLILQDCTRPTLAESALYQYSRGGSAISGPSIRLAESIARRWGNIASGIKEVSRSEGYSECIAYAWDLETGYYDERQFQVRHWRDTRSGGHPLTDERDIYELIANLGQRRKRAVILTVLPGDVVEAAVTQCEETLKVSADTSPDAIRKIVQAFGAFGVSKEQIEARCQCRAEAIRPAQVVQLRKIYVSLKDEMSGPGDWFDMSIKPIHPAAQGRQAPDAAPAARNPARTRAAEGRSGQDSGQTVVGPTDGESPSQSERTRQHEPDPDRVDRQVREMNERKAAQEPTGTSQTAPTTGTTQTTSDTTDAATRHQDGPGGPSHGFGGFEAWAVDANGKETRTEPYTDAVEFAQAVANMCSITPPLMEDIWEANEPAIRDACDASEEAGRIIDAIRTKPSIPTTDQGEAGAATDAKPAFQAQAVPTPAKWVGKPLEDYLAAVKQRLDACQSADAAAAQFAADKPTYMGRSVQAETKIGRFYQAVMAQLSGSADTVPQETTPQMIADSLRRSAEACKSVDEMRAFSNNGAIKRQVDELKGLDGGDALYEEVRSFVAGHVEKLKMAAQTGGTDNAT
jgi:hypothetical protein